MQMDCKKTAPVGVFDSGVGGLTVAREISRQLPNENIVYFGDTARVPYGSKSQNTIIRFSEQIIRFLKTKQVKAIVIACNTASALALDAVRDEFDIPIMGVVIPGARAAVETTRNQKVGVIGTDATQIDAMILGCTHYPLLRSKIRDYLGEEIKIVNPAYETAMDLKKLLYEKEMANDGTDAQHSVYSFYVSDAAEKFRRFANTVMPFDVPTTNVVNIEEY